MSVASIGDSQSIKNTIRNAFPFSVDKFRLFGPDYVRTNHFGLFRSDNLECVGNACRETYHPHTVDDVVLLAQSAASVFNGDCEIQCSWRDGHIVSLAPSKEYRRTIFGTDTIWPRLLISARYNSAFVGSLGWYRDACRNMAMLRSAGFSVSQRIRHSESLADQLADLRDQFSNVAAAWDGTIESLRAMDAKQVSLKEFLAEVYPLPNDAPARTRNGHERRIEAIFSRIYNERMKTGRGEITASNGWQVSAWEAFNGVQGYVQHQKNRRGNPSSFDRALLAIDDQAVLKAETLALSV